jgi:hypothetical protein
MIEQEWLACTDPEKMLGFLRGKASERKLRLFACACCRHQLCGQLNQSISAVVDVAEQYADGKAMMEEVTAVRKVARRAAKQAGCREWFVPSWVAANWPLAKLRVWHGGAESHLLHVRPRWATTRALSQAYTSTRSMAQASVVRSVSRMIARQASPIVVSFRYAHSYAWPCFS